MENEKEPMLEIHKEFVRQMNQVVQNKRLALQTEENGNRIAILQGYCGGFYTYKRLLKESGYDETEIPIEAELSAPFINAEGCILKLPELRSVRSQADTLQITACYVELQSRIKGEIERQKNTLFFESEKGRDLFWSKGWHESITQIARWIEDLDCYFSIAEASKKERLPFDDEE